MKSWRLAGVFLLVLALYGALAVQGPKPLLSPDETAVFASATVIWKTGRPLLEEPRARAFPWLHPRSFVARDGRLAMAGFPLWAVIVALVGWIGQGGAVLWLAAAVAASLAVPLVRLGEDELGLGEGEAVVWALAAAALPPLVLYGNRSLFGLVPQLALAAWAVWLAARPGKRAFLAGLVFALAVGIRPTEAVWFAPAFLALAWHWRVRAPGPARAFASLVAGGLCGLLLVAGVHAWAYGAPWRIGYLLRDLPAAADPAGVPVAAVSAWRRFFPYGVSLPQAWENLRGAWALGWAPWLVAWVAAFGLWVWRRARSAGAPERLAAGWMIAATAWLVFYYGQGRYADHIGGQAFHLGSSLFRYLAPAMALCTLWGLWAVRRAVPGRFARPTFFLLAFASVAAGIGWAYVDAEDGLLRGRRERVHYADVRAFVVSESPAGTIWASDRSDKMLFPVRAAASPLPRPEDLVRFLLADPGPVWLYRRPFGQAERDAWRAAGLEAVERRRYERENIYEVRLLPGFAERRTGTVGR